MRRQTKTQKAHTATTQDNIKRRPTFRTSHHRVAKLSAGAATGRPAVSRSPLCACCVLVVCLLCVCCVFVVCLLCVLGIRNLRKLTEITCRAPYSSRAGAAAGLRSTRHRKASCAAAAAPAAAAAAADAAFAAALAAARRCCERAGRRRLWAQARIRRVI